MRPTRFRRPTHVAPIAGVLALFVAVGALPAQEESLDLGSIDFPVSATGEARHQFEVGVLALHSFWYEEARDHFRKARELDPEFAMAYWGEAMTHQHLLWGPAGEEGLAAGRDVLRQLDRRAAEQGLDWTDRERAWVEAVRRLYGEDGHEERRQAFAAVMESLAERYPEDDEAEIFAALARMAVPGFELDDPEDVVSVAAPLERVYRRRPEHPGVLHYLIHVYDSPTFARMGLRQARVYADIAPASSHALHMPSHIFRELGMWEEMAASNEEAYRASVGWQERTDRPLHARDFHAYDWLHDAYLALGRYRDARELVEGLRELEARARREGQESAPLSRVRIRLQTRQLQMERWAGLGPDPAPVEADLEVPAQQAYHVLALQALGYRAAVAGQADVSARIQERMRAFEGSAGLSSFPGWLPAALHLIDAWRLRAAGEVREAASETEAAIGVLEEAGAGERLMLPFRRQQAELMLEQGRAEEAREVFGRLAETWPRRPRLHLGLARAAHELGRTAEAERHYRALLEVWDQADGKIPVLEEARGYADARGTGERDG